MNCKIPFTKDIPFEKKLYEITSISLEHEFKVEDDLLKGNFIISGDFKSHEVSINKEAFSYILPFEITLSENIDPKTIEFMIEDFTYEVLDNNILRVNIDFNVLGSTKEEPEEPTTEFLKPDSIPILNNEDSRASLDNILSNNEYETIPLTNPTNTPLENIPSLSKNNPLESSENTTKEITSMEVNSKTLELNTTSTKENLEENIEITSVKPSNPEATILNGVNASEDDYATYHIHMVSDGETVETICTMYNSNMNILNDYNELTNISPGDKLIIPEKNE